MAHLAMPGRLGIAHDVAARRLDLDYLGAEIAEDLRRERPQYDRRQIEDLDAGERPRSCFAHRVTQNMTIFTAPTLNRRMSPIRRPPHHKR